MFWLTHTPGGTLTVIDEEKLYDAAQAEYCMWRMMNHVDKLIAITEPPEKSRLWDKIWRPKK